MEASEELGATFLPLLPYLYTMETTRRFKMLMKPDIHEVLS